jgi:Holliday junction resolvase
MDQDALYQLTPLEFEQLAGRLLASEGIERVNYVGGGSDSGVDFVGEQNGEIIAVEVKHRERPFSKNEIWEVIGKLKSSRYNPSRLVFVTSANVPDSTKSCFNQNDPTVSLRIIDRNEVLRILNADIGLQKGLIANAEKRTRHLIHEFWTGIFVVILSIGINTILSRKSFFIKPASPPLTQRIETVESAIAKLKNLENELIGIKKEMIQTEKAAIVIKREYEDAKQLKQLTDEQFAAVRLALEKSSWQKSFLDNALGFLLGVGSSLVANAIQIRAKQKRVLADEDA